MSSGCPGPRVSPEFPHHLSNNSASVSTDGARVSCGAPNKLEVFVQRPNSEFQLAFFCTLIGVSLAAMGCSSSSSDGNGGNGVADGSGGATGTSGGSPATGGASKSDTGGSTGSGGANATGGTRSATGGSTAPATMNPTGGAVGLGGQSSTGGAPNTGGAPTGGRPSTGGSPATGGASGGALATGGKTANGGVPATGGATSIGGASATGGKSGNGGVSSTGGATGTAGSTSITGPCDIYQAGNTPCVAAHSTVRALYGAYSGKLYQVRRADKTVKDINTLTPGGLADSASQDTFCANTTCVVSIIYDQSSQGNHLTKTSGGWIGTNAKEADAVGIKLKVAGQTVYGIHVPSGVGYHNVQAKGTAVGDQPESMYMVANAKNYNDKCCFDYGNAETTSLDDGNGTMEAIYLGSCASWGSGEGKGPWVMADLENGLFSGQKAGLNTTDKSITSAFVTAMVKGKPHTFAIKSGDSQSGNLTTIYEGAYPTGGYDPMKKEGAIILGTGGDNSYAAVGDFFEGAMTSGYASDATENAIQANIVAAGYGR